MSLHPSQQSHSCPPSRDSPASRQTHSARLVNGEARELPPRGQARYPAGHHSERHRVRHTTPPLSAGSVHRHAGRQRHNERRHACRSPRGHGCHKPHAIAALSGAALPHKVPAVLCPVPVLPRESRHAPSSPTAMSARSRDHERAPLPCSYVHMLCAPPRGEAAHRHPHAANSLRSPPLPQQAAPHVQGLRQGGTQGMHRGALHSTHVPRCAQALSCSPRSSLSPHAKKASIPRKAKALSVTASPNSSIVPMAKEPA